MLGVWGLKGDKENASQVVPIVPLEEKSKAENHQRNMATQNLKCEIHRDVSRKPNMTRFHVSLRASGASVAINRQGIPSERSNTVDCFGFASQ